MSNIDPYECRENYPKAKSLKERFDDAREIYMNEHPNFVNGDIGGYSIPVDLLEYHVTISCLNCQLCNDESLPDEGSPIFSWSFIEGGFVIFTFVDCFDHDFGTKITVLEVHPYKIESKFAGEIILKKGETDE